MHDEAIRAAVAGMKKAEPWSEFWDDNDAEALARAAITAFLERVEVSDRMRSEVDSAAKVGIGKAVDDEALDRVVVAVIAQLRREL